MRNGDVVRADSDQEALRHKRTASKDEKWKKSETAREKLERALRYMYLKPRQKEETEVETQRKRNGKQGSKLAYRRMKQFIVFIHVQFALFTSRQEIMTERTPTERSLTASRMERKRRGRHKLLTANRERKKERQEQRKRTTEEEENDCWFVVERQGRTQSQTVAS